MATTLNQQVALDEALVPSVQRLRIRRSNFRLPSDIQSKEPILQVVYDVLRNFPFFKAFLVTADVPEIYMQEFWATTKLHQHSIRFKMDTRKHVLDLEAFREMLHIRTSKYWGVLRILMISLRLIPLVSKGYVTMKALVNMCINCLHGNMVKIQEVPTAETCTDFKPVEHVQNDAGYNVFSNGLQHSEQPESVSNTCLVETDDSNVIPDSPDM
nr:hypothetical protein [Tanacetum cinerariifolium]